MTHHQTAPVIVLTGGIGSGKSTVAAGLAGLGVSVVDADLLVHELTGPQGAALPDLRKLLGESYVCPSTGLDRPKLREAVFADPRLREQLEALLHPRVQSLARQRLAVAQGPYAAYVVPLWAETQRGLPRPDWVWKVVVVDINEESQRARVLKRTAMSKETLDGILAAQASRAERLQLADHILHNDGEQAALLPQVQRLHETLVRESKAMADRP